MSIIAQYKGTPEFTKIAVSTRRDCLRYIKLIEDEFGDLPISALADRRIRGGFKNWRDKHVNTPRKVDLAWTVLAGKPGTRRLRVSFGLRQINNLTVAPPSLTDPKWAFAARFVASRPRAGRHRRRFSPIEACLAKARLPALSAAYSLKRCPSSMARFLAPATRSPMTFAAVKLDGAEFKPTLGASMTR